MKQDIPYSKQDILSISLYLIMPNGIPVLQIRYLPYQLITRQKSSKSKYKVTVCYMKKNHVLFRTVPKPFYISHETVGCASD